MTLNRRIDPATLLRLDNAATIKLLTSCASVFADEGIFTPADADNLRLNLSALQFSEQANEPVLIQLVRQNAEFLTLLKSHFGGISLALNILRFSFRNGIFETVTLLGEFGEQLLGNAQLLFNRPFYIYLGGNCERGTLFSTVLVDFSELIYGSCESLQEIQDKLSTMLPNDKADSNEMDLDLDTRLAKELGFRQIAFDAIPYLLENQQKIKFVSTFTTILHAMTTVIEMLRYNNPKQDTAKLTILCDSLNAEIQLLSASQFPKTDNIEVWETQRLSFLTCLNSINGHLRSLLTEFNTAIAKSATIEGASRTSVPQDVVRSMTAKMIRDGVPALKANAAACALVSYCEKHKIQPKLILTAELSKIDPNLTVSSLEVFKELDSETSLVKTATLEKKRNLDRKDELLKLFHQKLSQLGILSLIPFLLFLTMCGVKTAPKSSLIDYRPAPHYHSSTVPLTVPSAPVEKDSKNDPKAKH
jgi:hypothetical protein